MKIIIYATHSFGTYETLKNHPDIVVVGFGTKWKGFIEKAKVIKSYLDTLPKDEIVVIIDGFDSYIKKTDHIKEVFEQFNCRVLVSIDDATYISKEITEYTRHKVFKECKDGYNVNAGLIMGYIEELKIVLDKIINGPSNDDQRNLNLSCKDFPFLKIDVEHIIFQNCVNIKEVEESKSFFCQIPATPSIDRIIRAVQEYSEYFIPEIVIVTMLIIYGTWFFYKRNILNVKGKPKR